MNSFQQCENFQSWVQRAHLFQCASFLNNMTKDCWNRKLMDLLVFHPSNHQGTFYPRCHSILFSLVFIGFVMISDVWSCGPMVNFLCWTWMMDTNTHSQIQLNSSGSLVRNLKRRVVLLKRFHGLTMVIGACRLNLILFFCTYLLHHTSSVPKNKSS